MYDWLLYVLQKYTRCFGRTDGPRTIRLQEHSHDDVMAVDDDPRSHCVLLETKDDSWVHVCSAVLNASRYYVTSSLLD
jgi:hypothetical protein